MKKVVIFLLIFTSILFSQTTFKDIDRQFEEQKGKSKITIKISFYSDYEASILGEYVGSKSTILGYEMDNIVYNSSYSVTVYLVKPTKEELEARRKREQEEELKRKQKEEKERLEKIKREEDISLFRNSIINNDVQGVSNYMKLYKDYKTIPLKDEYGDIKHYNSFIYALDLKSYDVANIFKNFADKEFVDRELSKKMIKAVRNKDTNSINTLISIGANINAGDENGKTALMEGINDIVIVKYLLNFKDIDLNVKIYEKTAFDYSTNKEIQKLLINAGANVKNAMVDGVPILIAYSYYSDVGMVKTLINNGFDPNIQTSEENVTALMITTNVGILKILVDAGADINKENINSSTPLMYGIMQKDINKIRYLIEQKVDINKKNNNNDSALTIALTNEYKEGIKLLLNSGAEFNSLKYNEEPIFIYYARIGDIDMVTVMLNNRADITLKDKNGKTALSITKDSKIKNLIKEYEKKSKSK